MRSLAAAALGCMLFLCGSCQKPAEVPYLDVTDQAAVPLRSLTFGWEGATCVIRVQSNGPWSLSAPAWVEAKPTSGAGVCDVTLSVPASASDGDGQADDRLTVSREGMEAIVVSLTRNPRPVVPDRIAVVDDKGHEVTELLAETGGMRITLHVDADKAWTVEVSDPWLNASSAGASASADIQLNVRANATFADRTGAFVFRSGDASATVKVVQTGEEAVVAEPARKADLLDVVFAADGSATDVSAAKLNVVKVASASLSVQYNETYKRYMAVFDRPSDQVGTTVKEGYYYADFENNATVNAGLADSHSLEILLCCEELPAPGTASVKPFSLMNNGGSGFMFSTTGSVAGQRRFTFLPFIGGAYRYVVADGVGIGAWHHVVGVWDSKAGKSCIYVDGRLSGSLDTPGEYTRADATANHFVIGADAAKGFTSAQSAFRGEIAVARAYSFPLTAGEVLDLYQSLGK